MTPKVTVSITAYNHGRFIRQALDSVLGQQTDFPVEILVGEDNSTDDTREIVKQYASSHPDRITAFYHEDASKLRINGRLTGRANLAHNLNAAHGEYIALLDGDDYWTDNTKLARQVEQLDADRTLSMSFHDAFVVDEVGATLDLPKAVADVKPRYQLADLIAGEFEIRTCSVLFRREAILPLPQWFFETAVGDFVLHVINGQQGDFGYIDRPMGAYRVHSGGVWSQGRSAKEWAEKSDSEARRSLNHFEMMTNVLSAVAQNAAPRFRPIARRRLAFFAYAAAKYAGGLGDKTRVRRNLMRLFRAHPWPADVQWRVLWRLFKKCL